MPQTRGAAAPHFLYLRDPPEIAQLDWPGIVEAIIGAWAAPPVVWRCSAQLDQADHVVLVRSAEDGRHIGLLSARSLATPREPFLFIQTILLTPGPRAGKLLQRMVAFAMLNISRPSGRVPRLVAACARDTISRFGMLELHRRFAGARRFPEPDSPAIDLAMASVARRIARTAWPIAHYDAASASFAVGAPANEPLADAAPSLVVLDLRAADEDAVQNDALRLYRTRAGAVPPAQPFEPPGAQPRVITFPPRKSKRH